MKNLLSLLIIMLVAFAVPVLAQEDMVDAGTTPDSFFWGLERTIENIDLLLTFNTDEKVKKQLNYAEKRLSEVKAMVEIGNMEAAQKAEESHGKLFSDLKGTVQNYENSNSEESLKKVLDIEGKIRNHSRKLEDLNGNLKTKVEVEGKITPEQKALMDSVLAGLKGQVGEVEIEIEKEKDKTKIKIEQELGKDSDEVEIEFEEELGLRNELREDAQEEIEDLEENIIELTEEGITVPENVKTLLEQAKSVFEAGDYRNAERLAEQGDDQLDKIEDELEEEAEREIEVEIEDGRSKIKIEVGRNKYEFNLNTTDQDVIINEVTDRTSLSREEILSITEFEVEEEENAEEAKEKASDAIDDAIENIADSQEDINEANSEGEDRTEAEEKLAEAQATLNEAQREFDAGNFVKAKELAEKADDLVDEAEDLIGFSKTKETENEESGEEVEIEEE